MPATRRRTELRHLVSLTEAAARAGGVNVRTVRRWIADGRITGYRVGPKLIKVDAAELDGIIRPVAAAGR